MALLVLDDRRFADEGFDASVASFVALRPELEPLSFTAFAARFGTRVLAEPVRDALLRRLARRPEAGLPAPVVKSTCFAARARAALDSGDPSLSAAFAALYRATLGSALEDARAFWERAEIAPGAIDASLLTSGARQRALELGAEVVDFQETPELRADAPQVLAAVQRLLVALDRGTDDDLRAFALSTLSPLANADARALAVAALREGSFAQAVAANTLRLRAEGREALYRLRTALDACGRAYRAPGATASSVLAEIALAFDLRREGWRSTLHALEVAAAAFDAAREMAGESAWRGSELACEFEAAIHPLAPQSSLQPQGALAHETPLLPGIVNARRSAYSASSLNTYAECARKWYFRYVCAAIEDPGSSASTYGRAFHHALEEFHRAYPRPGDVSAVVLHDVLAGLIATAFDRYRDGFTEKVEFELQRRRALRTGKRYVQYIIERFGRAPFTVIGCELEVALDLEGYTFIGYIDRVDREDRSGGVAIVDYKTGSIAKSAAEYRDAVLTFSDFQLPFYYWAQTAAGERVTRLALVPLKEAHLDVRPIELEVVPLPLPDEGRANASQGLISVRDLERARAKMIEICAAIERGGPTHFPATDDPEACRYCIYVEACREAPLDIEARFAR